MNTPDLQAMKERLSGQPSAYAYIDLRRDMSHALTHIEAQDKRIEELRGLLRDTIIPHCGCEICERVRAAINVGE